MSSNTFYAIALILFAVRAASGANNLTSSCGGNWFEIPNHGCFLFELTTKLSWYDAQAFCEDSGGHLVEGVDTSLEEALIGFTTLIGDGDSSVHSWLGGNDIGEEGTWRWIHSAELITETFWASDSRPKNDDTINCLDMDNYGTKGWYDYDCETELSIICQRPSGWTACATITTTDSNENYKELLNCPKNPGLAWKLVDSYGTCAETETGLIDWERPDDNAEKSLRFYLEEDTRSGYISPSSRRDDADNCNIKSDTAWKDTDSIYAYESSGSITVYYS